MKVKITIPNLEQKIAKMGRDYLFKEMAIKKQVLVSAIRIETQAKATVRVDTGRLRGSLDHTYSHTGLDAEVGTNVHYAPYVEAKYPYLAPSAFLEKPKFVLAIKEIIRK